MTHRGILLRLPGLPYRLEDVCPDWYLATAVSHLDNAGVEARVADFGTLESLAHARKTEPHTYRQNLVDLNRSLDFETLSLSHLQRNTPETGTLDDNEGYADFCARAVGSISHPSVGFILVKIDHEKDMDAARILVRHVRSMTPRTKIIGVGSWMERSEEAALEHADDFDCIYFGRPDDASLLRLVESIDRPTMWRNIPNLAYKHESNLHMNRIEPTEMAEDAIPNYDDRLYPAMADESMLRLFHVEDIVYAPSGAPGTQTLLRGRPSDEVAAEMVELDQTDACAGITVTGVDSAAPHVERLAYQLLKRRSTIHYCREAHINNVVPQGLPSLHASGCRAMRFRIHSGSQRLIEDFYEEDFGISQTERIIRASKFSNIFTVTHFTYPCPEDDFHTRAETVRLLDRSRPHSVEVDSYGRAHTPRRGIVSWFRHPDLHTWTERDTLLEELDEAGHSCQVSPEIALLAERSRQKGSEGRYALILETALKRADTEVLTHLFRLSTEGEGTTGDRILDFRPFIANQKVVGN